MSRGVVLEEDDWMRSWHGQDWVIEGDGGTEFYSDNSVYAGVAWNRDFWGVCTFSVDFPDIFRKRPLDSHFNSLKTRISGCFLGVFGQFSGKNEIGLRNFLWKFSAISKIYSLFQAKRYSLPFRPWSRKIIFSISAVPENASPEPFQAQVPLQILSRVLSSITLHNRRPGQWLST